MPLNLSHSHNRSHGESLFIFIRSPTQACMHEWVLFTGIAHIMKGCGCAQHDESSEFVIVKGIIIFKHSSDKIDNIMLNELTRQVALLAEERASWLVSCETEYTYKTVYRQHTCCCYKIADMHISF